MPRCIVKSPAAGAQRLISCANTGFWSGAASPVFPQSSPLCASARTSGSPPCPHEAAGLSNGCFRERTRSASQ